MTVATLSIWWLFAAVCVGLFLLFAAVLAWAVERAHRKLWQKRARRAGYVKVTERSQFSREPAAGRPVVSVRDRQW